MSKEEISIFRQLTGWKKAAYACLLITGEVLREIDFKMNRKCLYCDMKLSECGCGAKRGEEYKAWRK